MAEEPLTREQEGEQSVEELKKALAEERTRAEGLMSSLQRWQADYRNLQKRTDQEKKESLAWSNADLIKSLLPVVDDMERALSLLDTHGKDSDWLEGFKIIQRNLQEVLRSHGCKEIECIGQPFDPNLHEAIAHEPGEEGVVISEHRKGYIMKDKVLRASQVIVGNGQSKEGS